MNSHVVVLTDARYTWMHSRSNATTENTPVSPSAPSRKPFWVNHCCQVGAKSMADLTDIYTHNYTLILVLLGFKINLNVRTNHLIKLLYGSVRLWSKQNPSILLVSCYAVDYHTAYCPRMNTNVGTNIKWETPYIQYATHTHHAFCSPQDNAANCTHKYSRNHLWFLSPTQLSIQGQWWSKRLTQRLHILQCFALIGCWST